MSDKLPGGIGDKTRPEDVDPEELREGVKHELEHTDDPKIAVEIALDHLTEDPRYYSRLQGIEKSPKDDRTFITGDEFYEVLHEVMGVLVERGASVLAEALGDFLDGL